MELSEKVKRLNLLPLSPDLLKYIYEYQPIWARLDTSMFSYAKFYGGEVHFYTIDYINSVTVEEFNIQFNKI